MTSKIDFPPRHPAADPRYAHGRNGYFQATAIQVLSTPNFIRLENWTSKGAIGIGHVTLPPDRNGGPRPRKQAQQDS
ncbi:MAG: hypothetical protein EOS25_05015 [Mesorhizobium sp.]|uniref:hypothetical protein n=1 Tax=Mesorhizobium sp. TaxID=1871066 RepID=UPI000FE45F95|nr:hypothetical protein [Mesorhizobium sp.]RWD50864.1 MAG: hypothetical protein EOS59_07685 [Mesorhizobium sp.]RWE58573.1 MAG: hypothetical protein EOS24_17595 [Mesorhizobium sp.]RWF09192.1 MAG: hypothetical protein EOS69_20395 [Mesorhizobium sp.]RWF21394.1 MAG: hypothetical protein EOS25_05015 [Mesorhizobium sp.]TIW48076.1 MAG: hypothetical protein E5V71_02780 [Mesorhizobium sp.]